jgi:cell division septation protein DedD
MRNNETGEFELVVGNRQLLSGFFIVVLLFAVAFAMGYVVGQNSPRSARVAAEAAAATPAVTEPRPMPASAPAPPPNTAPSAPQETAAAAPPASDASGPQPATQPAREVETPGATQAQPPPLPGPPGAFWQVMAVPQADADVIIATLKKKGFPALGSPGPNNLTRVLVGPYSDTAAMGKAKTDLENAGFPHPIRK